MKIGKLDVQFHRTVRVAEGRSASNLPPSLGRATITAVKDFKDNCPETWDEDGYFVPLHDREALWLQFSGGPVAVLVGAGGINALTGQKLGTNLEAGNYLVTPGQPWLDGWKAEDGTVYQFVGTPYKAGDGLSVGEQILGAESKSGGIGIAVFEPKPDAKMKPAHSFSEGLADGAYEAPKWYGGGGVKEMSLSASAAPASLTRGMRGAEMGVGKGGKITQKIYADPHGMEVWQETPSAAMAIYLVSAEDYKTITGIEIPSPRSNEEYGGKWFGLDDEAAPDLPGTPTFAGLKSVFAGDTSNVTSTADAEEDPVEVASA